MELINHFLERIILGQVNGQVVIPLVFFVDNTETARVYFAFTRKSAELFAERYGGDYDRIGAVWVVYVY